MVIFDWEKWFIELNSKKKKTSLIRWATPTLTWSPAVQNPLPTYVAFDNQCPKRIPPWLPNLVNKCNAPNSDPSTRITLPRGKRKASINLTASIMFTKMARPISTLIPLKVIPHKISKTKFKPLICHLLMELSGNLTVKPPSKIVPIWGIMICTPICSKYIKLTSSETSSQTNRNSKISSNGSKLHAPWSMKNKPHSPKSSMKNRPSSQADSAKLPNKSANSPKLAATSSKCSGTKKPKKSNTSFSTSHPKCYKWKNNTWLPSAKFTNNTKSKSITWKDKIMNWTKNWMSKPLLTLHTSILLDVTGKWWKSTNSLSRNLLMQTGQLLRKIWTFLTRTPNW